MIWTILLIVLIGVFLYRQFFMEYEDWDISPLWPAAFLLCVLAVWIYIPMKIPRSMQEDAEKIIYLRRGINEIRSSIYESNKKEMFDAKNMSQSKSLTAYTEEVLKLESNYNSELKGYQLALHSRSSYWFGIGALLPNEIMEFKPL